MENLYQFTVLADDFNASSQSALVFALLEVQASLRTAREQVPKHWRW